MHLANYSINKYSKDFVEDLEVEDILKPNNASKRTMEAMYAQILEQTKDPETIETLKKNIHKLCQTTMSALTNFILLYTNPYNPNSKKNFTFACRPF